MDMGTVCSRLAALAATIPGMTGTGYLPDGVTTPHFFTAEYDITFDTAHGRGCDSVELTCRVLVSRADDMSGQVKLHSLLSGGTYSLKTVLESGRQTGADGTSLPAIAGGVGACDDYRVTRCQAMRVYQHMGADYYGADLIITVIG
jgi:hypothetical protein